MYMQVCNLFLYLQEWWIFAQKLGIMFSVTFDFFRILYPVLLLLYLLSYVYTLTRCQYNIQFLVIYSDITTGCFHMWYLCLSGCVCVTVWAHSCVLEYWDFFKHKLTESIPLTEVISALKFSGAISCIKVDAFNDIPQFIWFVNNELLSIIKWTSHF